MKKITGEERAHFEELAKQYGISVQKEWQDIRNKLDKDHNDFINREYESCQFYEEYIQHLKSGRKPSEFFSTKGNWLFDGCILKRHKDSFMYAADNCVKWIYPTGWNRRPFRSGDYMLYRRKIIDIIHSFIYMRCIDEDFADILEGNIPPEQLIYKENNMNSAQDRYLIAYGIDSGNERIINYVRETLDSGNGSAINYEILAGVFMGSNTELHELTCKLLLAARLQEGLRQAICENADCGRIEPFLMIIRTIRDNDLIRYSSIKRAAGCWLGLMTEETRDLERISAKSLDIIINCLESEDFTKECLETEDSMKIYIALWSIACHEFHTAEQKIKELISSGTSHQAMTAGVFINSSDLDNRQQFAVQAILGRHEELNVTAVFLPMMYSTNTYWSNVSHKSVRVDSLYERESAEKLYVILNSLLEKLKKDIEFTPCVFPWNSEALTRSDIVKRLCVIASDLKDSEKIDETCVKIPLIKDRPHYIEMLLSAPETDIQLDVLVSLAGDREMWARKEVFKILASCDLKEKHFTTLENMLKYKAADMRQNIIDILMRQTEDQLFDCAKRLITDKKEEKRTAGLDIIIRMTESENADADKFCALTEFIKEPTSKEKILIERILGTDDDSSEPALYSKSDDFTPVIDEQYIADCKKYFTNLFPTTSLFCNKPDGTKYGLHEILTALDKLIEDHKNEEYFDSGSREIRLMSDNAGYFSFKVKDGDNEHIAFKELWDDFYKTHINSPELVFRLKLLWHFDWHSSGKLAASVFGQEYAEEHEYMHGSRIYHILNYYAKEYPLQTDLRPAAAALGYYIAYEAGTDELYDFVDYPYTYDRSYELYLDGKKLEFKNIGKYQLVTVMTDKRLQCILRCLDTRVSNYDSHFRDIFSVKYRIGQRFGYFDRSEKEKLSNSQMIGAYTPFSVSMIILAGYKEIITPGFMYRLLMEYELKNSLSDLSLVISFLKSGETKAASRYYSYGSSEGFIRDLLDIRGIENITEHKFTEKENELLRFAAEIGENVIDTVLETELTRGDTGTRFSSQINNIKRIYGAEKFVKILAAMGRDTLSRSTYFYTYGEVSKKDSLSYLLGVCVPNADDNAEKLKTLLSQTDVSQTRLVEAALFSPPWIDIIEDYLGWNGFKAACYYFIAHTSEIPGERTRAVIAKYTPIPAEELSNGAFDIEWFRDALATVGEERFNVIYDAAKYISDGAKHTRARKYADAVCGRLVKDDAVKNITEKRSKDTLMAYALIPLDGEDDMAERYLFIQEFRKQAKQFGAQRKASENAAADCALQNLSKNAGFTDVSRLTLRMEAKLFENIKPLLEWNDIGDIKLRLEISDSGKTEIKCEKNGKALKSVPAKYKKNEIVVKLSETKKMLAEQYRRTRDMFEDAMESRTLFTFEELNMLCTNPVLKPIVSRLVYMCREKLGFINGCKLVDFAGNEMKLTKKSELKPAHPFDIYTEGHWHEYQKYVFENQIVQPFKQVFRELYVKTAEEASSLRSLRYAGNQIQPQKTKACLKTRRWVCDIESGLQKIYYKENIIASIYALADWFSPADIEAPTLEWVEFSDRKTGKEISIGDVPDIIFSEVMRDVDLAVSVAHAGGVDPETSHSTVEMRKAIVEFSLPLFKLHNVRLEGSHAFITGERADYSIHLGSGVVHLQGGPMINILPVHSQHRGRIFLPFIDDDPKTSQIISEIILFAEDAKIKDPFILDQIK